MMNRKFVLSSIVSIILAAAAISSLATDDNAKSLGTKVESPFAGRAVVIGPNTTYVNVTQGDVVKFVVGNTSFVWSFDGPSTQSEMDLNAIAPSGVLDHHVKIYVSKLWTTNGP
jgi:hypothetical protein